MTARYLPLIALPLFFAGCGYVGDPLPPLANIPAKVDDLAAVQRGSRIVVQFTPPERTTEGILIRTPLHLDLRIGSANPSLRADAWAVEARRIPGNKPPYEIPIEDWIGKEVFIAVNVIGDNGKESGWSSFVNLPVVPPPPQPSGFRPELTADGVRLLWEGPPGEFRVFRRAGEETSFTRTAEVLENSWTDRSAEYGKSYTYLVQRIQPLGAGREAESEPSEEKSVTPKDKFAPAAPAELRAAAGPDSVALSWARGIEPDLAGYRIYRGAADSAPDKLEKLADTGPVPAWSDRAVEHGKTYRYAVTALDHAGNESAPSAPVEAAIP